MPLCYTAALNVVVYVGERKKKPQQDKTNKGWLAYIRIVTAEGSGEDGREAQEHRPPWVVSELGYKTAPPQCVLELAASNTLGITGQPVKQPSHAQLIKQQP